MDGDEVLVTGGSGFIGSYCILQLLERGYRVRSTLRSPDRESGARAALRAGGVQREDALTFVQADLLSDRGWPEAVSGCTFVLHVASPFPLAPPRHADELIVPARDGALRVLRAARDAGVRRVVLTSSFAAVGYGHPESSRPFSEDDWTDLNASHLSAYVQSKTIAERAAWDFMAREGKALELSTVNPVGVLGPVMGPDYSSSIELLKRLLDGALPGLPQVSFGLVDVRDVADLHLRAMTSPDARGQRFLAVAGAFMTVQEIAHVLRARLGADANRVPTRLLPNWMLRLLAVFSPSVRQVVPELGRERQASNEKARRVLAWTPRPNEEAITAGGESLIRLGLLKPQKKAV